MPIIQLIVRGGLTMPRYDGTGPQGQGSKTGRGMGKCNGSTDNQGFGRGCGRQNRFFRNNFHNSNDEITSLKEKIESLEKLISEKL
jgi:hypothetical protein